jgi:hypothetical protein
MRKFNAANRNLILARARVLGIAMPEYCVAVWSPRHGNKWDWVPYDKMRYKDQRVVWSEFLGDIYRKGVPIESAVPTNNNQ